MKTYSQKPSELTRKWYIVDAKGKTLGRLATVLATRLTGKHKPTYTPHIDDGDTVVVINAGEIKVTGDKLRQKRYYRHSGFPGGISSKTLEQQFNDDSTKILERAVAGMIPDNKLKPERLKRLKIYPSDTHPHMAQQPEDLGVTNGR